MICHRKVKKILILMDQENDEIAYIYKNVEGLMRNNFTSFKEKISEHRVKVYECKYGGYKFDLLVVINGIDEIESEYHTIEDHLIMVGNIQIEKGKNSKDAWKKLNKEEKKKIYIKLNNNLKKYVPQQYYACSLLENY